MTLLKLFKKLQIISLDVSLGAAVVTLFISHLLGVKIDPLQISALSFTVLVIYNFDHLFDLYSINSAELAERRGQHNSYSRILKWVCIISMIFLFFNLFLLDFQTIRFGFALSIIVGIYFVSINFNTENKKVYHKELLAALIYTSGLFLVPFSNQYPQISLYSVFLFGEVFLIALTNLFIYSYFDYPEDLQEGQPSLAVTIGRKNIAKLINVVVIITLLVISFVSLVINPTGQGVIGQVVLSLMISGTWILFAFNSKLKEHNRYRLLGDTIFFMPLIYFLV